MTEAGLDAAARSLRAWLNRQQFSDLSTPEVTAFFTESVADWATNQGYEVQREVELPTATRQNRTGRLDLQLRHRSGKGRLISIEVDRGTKEWSLEKLVQAAELGHLALWLRWSRTPVTLPIPPTVRLIRAQVLKRTTLTRAKVYSLRPDNCGWQAFDTQQRHRCLDDRPRTSISPASGSRGSPAEQTSMLTKHSGRPVIASPAPEPISKCCPFS
ncbi:hypothetical protein AB0N88_33020 [Streptomyces sp. NPDC093516]|uniref:hypothetical protein n=1 Tax=Streptomyces sp. NPDC093516 TaxID=3155304 RepID=UPI0034188688